jgi:hypothetical protein
MMQCNKTGLTLVEWKTILDVLNVYDPNDICHVYPEMGSPEFIQDVGSAFKKVHKHITAFSDTYKNISTASSRSDREEIPFDGPLNEAPKRVFQDGLEANFSLFNR